MTDASHAISNARAWLDEIREGMAALRALEDGAEMAAFDGDEYEDADDLRSRLEERPLSLQVRSGWYHPGAEVPAPSEYEILLTTGGPGLRIMGELTTYGEPDGGALQYQDWGIRWTDYDLTAGEHADLTAFAQLFYFST